ncbi:tRNA epoxyqueuosine(34) reductase QueG [Sediminibacterium ginsengisoli]|uniref:Epoxyqueuosine reductase n=1 Tax=Sediminibacterium ginsengisoli TaxID=413434 RepID=A0A1T4QHL9_9BACT|nr:tRNA epoxyqueuosine(34) reductase QueG [Sediminibacterium ginsengisoli]SKA03290.1 epoxyqueuosine reductase [Sediminibacterium ginsengisoli]
MDSTASHTTLIKSLAQELGFHYCGIAKAVRLDDDARRLEAWLNKGFHGQMQYMENHFDLRIDPSRLVPGAKSVITLLKNYYPSQEQKAGTPHIARYAFGKDYHEVIREQLNHFLHILRGKIGEIQGRGFVDSAPVLERSWATRSGAGWIGKNGNLITRQSGSFFFIATLIVDLPLEYDDPFAKDYCGSCRKCIDACPTDAIEPDKEINGSKCISYYTIELKDAMLPDNMKDKFDNWMFGCDVCQEVCPWNRFSKPHTEPAFTPIPEILNLSTSEWLEMSEITFREVFRHSPLKRSKFNGIRRNLNFLKND